MPDLFPTVDAPTAEETKTDPAVVAFGRSWRFDFEKGEFVLIPTGSVATSENAGAWLEWCKKALLTTRYHYLVYSRNHGQEFEALISRHLSREGNESEIRRIATECLKVDPRTAQVASFVFSWESDAVFFTCEVTNVRGESGKVDGSVVIS